jgi:hypothetical protein
MTLLTPDLRAALHANAVRRHMAIRDGQPDPDPMPVVKFFHPAGPATWLATEMDADGDSLFGLADLGFGCPEAGTFSLGAIIRLRLPFGPTIERDRAFATAHPLSVWADQARRCGSIIAAEAALAGAAHPPSDDPELPPA